MTPALGQAEAFSLIALIFQLPSEFALSTGLLGLYFSNMIWLALSLLQSAENATVPTFQTRIGQVILVMANYPRSKHRAFTSMAVPLL